MLKRFIAPIAILAVILVQVTISSLNGGNLASQDESDRDYFIKPISQSNVVVVEPNYGRFFHPDKTIEKDEAGDILYTALQELDKEYDINYTQMIVFDRKGQTVPNLYVHMNQANADPNPSEELLADELIASESMELD